MAQANSHNSTPDCTFPDPTAAEMRVPLAPPVLANAPVTHSFALEKKTFEQHEGTVQYNFRLSDMNRRSPAVLRCFRVREQSHSFRCQLAEVA